MMLVNASLVKMFRFIEIMIILVCLFFFLFSFFFSVPAIPAFYVTTEFSNSYIITVCRKCIGCFSLPDLS